MRPPRFRNRLPAYEYEITHASIGQPFDYFGALLEREVRIWTLWVISLAITNNINAKNTHPIERERNVPALKIDARTRAICQARTPDVSLSEGVNQTNDVAARSVTQRKLSVPLSTSIATLSAG